MRHSLAPLPVTLPVTLLALLCATPSAGQTTLEQVVVTATREARDQYELPESVGVISGDQLAEIMPAHPAEALNRLAGVYVNDLGGEGHMTAIRQPLTTAGVYLFLEDGIPTRPTGFFNHNGLYEINIAQAAQVEVTKGPGSALYGSDAIGGIINSLTPAPAGVPEGDVSLELGSFGWQRLLAAGSGGAGAHARLGGQVNLTRSQGFRDAADYERASLTGRWDANAGPWSGRTILTWTQVDQSGVSGLGEDDYRHDPEKNLYHGDVGFRDVRALRLSSQWDYQAGHRGLLSLTPYYRYNTMELMPSWMISYDPNVSATSFRTLGLLARYRQDQPVWGARWIAGVDVDFTPSEYREDRVSLERSGEIFVDYSPTGRRNYQFTAQQLSVSPYLHAEWQAAPRWRLTAGLRYDFFRVDYEDELGADVPERGVFEPIPWPTTHLRPPDQTLEYDQWSPKLGAVFDLHDRNNLYASYRHAFRVPTAGQLFRAGSNTNSSALQPVRADSFELGLRGQATARLAYELALYHMTVSDEIVSYIDNTTLDRKNANAGETLHRGVELTVDAQLSAAWSTLAGFSYTRQTYEDFSYICGSLTCNYAGYDVPRAPRTLGNWTLAYAPPALSGLRLELEWLHVGEYYTDETNTRAYPGHELFSLRGRYAFGSHWEVFARLQNLTNATHSTYTANQVGNPELEYRPGPPRAVYAGFKVVL